MALAISSDATKQHIPDGSLPVAASAANLDLIVNKNTKLCGQTRTYWHIRQVTTLAEQHRKVLVILGQARLMHI
jgi:hypothetical protein